MYSESTPLLTVVIPTYNRKSQLRKAVKSVTDQQASGVIIHIFDNCSTDGTESVIQELMDEHDSIIYTRRDSNIGSLGNYSDAIRSVKTPFLISLADDDWLLDSAIQKLLDTMLDDESLGAVISQTIHQNENGETLRINPGKNWEYRRYEPEEFIPLWVEKGHFEWSSIVFRRSALDVAGVPDVSTYLVWDVDLQLQVFLRFPVTLIQHESAVYLIHPEQSSRQTSYSKFEGQLTMLNKAMIFANNHPSEFCEYISKFSHNWVLRIAYEVAYDASLCYFFKTVLSFPSRKIGPKIFFYYILVWIRLKLRIFKSHLG